MAPLPCDPPPCVTANLTARRRRERAAAKYRPKNIVLLLVAEAPPDELDRYFYFENVAEHDDLFREVVRSVLAEEPLRHKAAQLRCLQECGVFVIDLKADLKVNKKEDLSPYVGHLVRRVQEHEAGHASSAMGCGPSSTPSAGAARDAGLSQRPALGTGQQRSVPRVHGRLSSAAGCCPTPGST